MTMADKMGETYITAKEASKRWGEPVKYVYKVCKYYKLPKLGFPPAYHIPESLQPILIPDGRYNKAVNKEWLYVLCAIIENKLIDTKLFNSNERRIEGIIFQLQKANFISLLPSANKSSLNYQDYQITLKYFQSNWKGLAESDKYTIVNQIVEAITKGSTAAILEKYG